MDTKRSLNVSVAFCIGVLLLVAQQMALQRAATAARPAPSMMAADIGDVVINEVAWMGTQASPTDEWIELHNTTDAPISLTGWSLVADDGSPSVALSGVIPPEGYYLLERSDDGTVSDIPADQIYSGALENDPVAETLTLRNAGGALIDAVNADGGGWPAGDNSTKHTMERRDPTVDGADGNWSDNNGVIRNGLDDDGSPINGTPKARNSVLSGANPYEADVIVAKSGPATARPSGIITYSIAVSNTGAVAASQVWVTDRLPGSVSFLAQYGSLPFHREGNLLTWSAGDLPTGTSPLRITVTGQLSAAASPVITNVVTATTTTTETNKANNRAAWSTRISASAGSASMLINALLYDGYQTNDRDEAVQLVNVSSEAIDLAGWRVCDRLSGGACATIVSGTLDAGETAWLAYWATSFYTSSGVYPAYAQKGLVPDTQPLSGSWPRYANAGEQVILLDSHGNLVDSLVYEEGDPYTPGWSGTSVRPWSGREGFRIEGQILYRALDEATGLPVPDTDSAADWAQYAFDPLRGRRVRYPGWDLNAFYQPSRTTETAHVTVGVAPDNAAEVVLAAIDSAQNRIEIGVYALTHPTIIRKLVAKATSGVSVTVLLEGDQAGVAKDEDRWHQQMWACQLLHETGNGACWFMVKDESRDVFPRYRFMHAKYLVIDRAQALISSQNLTLRGLPDDDRSNGTHGSRGVVLLTDAPAVVSRLAQVFEHDSDPIHHTDLLAWSPLGSDYGPPPPDFTPILSVTDYTTYAVAFSTPLALEGTFAFELLTAPEAALRQSDGLLGLLAQADDGDEVYVETMDESAQWGVNPIDDPSLRVEAYIAAARRGARVRILLNNGKFDAEYYDAAQNAATVAYVNEVAHAEGLDLRAATGDPTQYGLHNKMILVWFDGDAGYAHVGSLNGSETSNKVNREVALQVRSNEVYAYLERVFERDWAVSNPLYLPLLTRGWSPPGPPADHPLISEALYNPSGVAETDEWVEIYNPTDRTVVLAGWYLGDVGPRGEFGSGHYRFPDGTALPAYSTLLIARQAQDVMGFTPDFEFLADPLRDDPHVPNMEPAGVWDGFGFALGNTGDEVILLDETRQPVDVLVYGTGSYADVLPHPGVGAEGHSLERRPALYDTDDCARDFFDRYPPEPREVSLE